MARRRKIRAARRNAERQRRHAEAVAAGAEVAEEPLKRRYARSRTILEGLMARGSISPEQMRAGDRLATDYRRSHTRPTSLTSRYEPGPRPPKRYQAAADTPASFAARERFERALGVLGELTGIIVHVVVVDQPVSSWGPLNGHPVASGVARLRDGLDVLSDHYNAWRRST